MFNNALVRLTLWYLALIMALSLLFSIVLYNNAASQLDTGFSRQNRLYQDTMDSPFAPTNRFNQGRQDILDDTHARLLNGLAALNLVILVVGGGLSYLLARRTLQPIQDSLEAQQRFTADASHELRTPLTAMRSEIEVALRSKLTAAEAKQLLQSNLEEIDKLEQLAGGLLQLAQTDPTKLRGEFKPVPLKLVVQEVVRQLKPAAKARQVTVQADIDEASVMGDRASLEQLVTILLDNAIKYSPEKSTIQLSTEIGSRSVSLSVIDHGRGIKASDLPYIFNRFYRADPSRGKEQITGYGLGLSIAKIIAELHRGRIDVTSTPGHGSTFTAVIPTVNSES